MELGRHRIRSNEWMKPVFGWPVIIVLLAAAWWAATKIGADNPANWPELMEGWQRDHARDPVPFYIAGGSAVVFLLMIIKLVVDTVSLLRFGVISLEPDPSPGSIGGQVGGTIRLAYQPKPGDIVTITVVCWRHYVKRSGGKSQTATEKYWSRDIQPETGQAFNESVLRFTADIPEDLPASGKHDGDRYRWQVILRIERPGRDIVRQFTVPVETSESPRMAARPMRTDSTSPPPFRGMQVDDAATLVIRSRLGRNLGMNLAVVLFGGLFTGAGVFLGVGVAWDHAQELFAGGGHWASVLFSSMFVLIPGFMSLVFTLIGGLILLAGLHGLLDRRWFRLDGDTIRTRNWIGEQAMPLADIDRFELAETSSMGTRTHHDLYAVSADDVQLKLLAGIPGRLAARRIAGIVAERTGIEVKDVGKRSRLAKRLKKMARQSGAKKTA